MAPRRRRSRRVARRNSRDGAMVLGITGGIASGKSAVARRLRERGAVVFSADEASRAVLSPSGAILAALTREFGPEIVAHDGTLDRAALGARVFSDARTRERLNRIMHPAILRLLRAQIDAAREDLRAETLIVIEVPLLFETNLSGWFERIVVVAASEPTQIARLIARNGLDEAEARRRLASQWPIEEKAKRADFVIWNDGSLADLEREADRVWEELKRAAR